MKFSQKTIEDYIPTAGRVKDFLHKVDCNQAGDPKKAALAIMQVVNSTTPPLRLALGK
jgi:hypothetical protein